MLTDELRAALEERIRVIADEKDDDPAHQDLPMVDHIWLIVLLIICLVAVPVWQALRVA